MTETDPIALEIQWNRLITIANEADQTVVRTSFSSVVGEAHDFACVLLDATGRSVAQSTLGPTLFTATLPRTLRTMLEEFPAATLRDGDVLCTNDPWIGTGHLPDLCIAVPTFYRDRLIGYVGVVAHISDIGGTAGYHDAPSIYQEGLQLPPCRLYRAGEPTEALAILAKNVRVPDQVLGDVRAIVAAGHVGRERLIEFMEDYGLESIDPLGEAVRRLSSDAMARAIAAIPDGVYAGETVCDGWDSSLTIRAAITVRGGSMLVDYAGTSPEVAAGAINVTLSTTIGDTHTTMKSALAPHLPNNEGLFSPIEVRAPLGSILNCRYPASVKARSKTMVHTHEALYAALADVLPDRLQAGSGSFWIIIANGYDARDRAFNAWVMPNGGKGATAAHDGYSACPFPINPIITPTEVLESKAPVRLERKELEPNTAGPGRFRGGFGQRVELVTTCAEPVAVTLRPDTIVNAPPGLLGGRSGKLGSHRTEGNHAPEARDLIPLGPGERITFVTAGGSGFGPPFARDPARVLADVEAELLSVEQAAAEYGVVITSGRVDEIATARRREV